jgi:hypothetical protein
MKKAIFWVSAVVLVSGVCNLPAVADEHLIDGIDLSGDLRLRHEYIDVDDGRDERHRQRVRARIKAKFDVNEEVSGVIRLASGSDDPVSSNQSFDDAFSTKGINLDQAYLKWAVAEGVVLSGGKMAKPWILVSELVWDGDVNPEGFNAAATLGEGAAIVGNVGYWWLDEISGTTDDRVLVTAQAAIKTEIGDGAKLTVGGSVYAYDNMKGLAPLVDATDGFGNSITTTVDPATMASTSTYDNDYTIFEGFAQVKTSLGDQPLKIFGNYAVNDDASSEDTGFLVGVKVGKAKGAGTCEAKAVYRDVEADAVVGALTDSDFGGGGTGSDGVELGGKMGVSDNWTAGATVFLNDLGAGTDYTRVQLDLVAKF